MRCGKLNFLLGELLFLVFFLFAFLSLIGLSPLSLARYDLDETQLVLFQHEGDRYFHFFAQFPLNGKYRFEPSRSAPLPAPTVRDFWNTYRLDLTGDKPVVLSRESFSGTVPHPVGLGLLAAFFVALFLLWTYLRWRRCFPRPARGA